MPVAEKLEHNENWLSVSQMIAFFFERRHVLAQALKLCCQHNITSWTSLGPGGKGLSRLPRARLMDEEEVDDTTPADLRLRDIPFAIHFHPKSPDLLLVGLVSGSIAIHDLSGDDVEQPVTQLSGGSRGSCRVAAWASSNERTFFSGYENGSIVAWDWRGVQCSRTWDSSVSGAASVSTR